MGIHCEINLSKPPNGVFIGSAGTVVSGVVKYAVDEESIFNKITISLKGHGILRLVSNTKDKDGNRKDYYRREPYLDMDNVINKDSETGMTFPVGAYETPFNFVIPYPVPSSLEYSKLGVSYKINCNITYYVRIKFSRPGFMKFDKRFKKEITVVSGIIPKLPTSTVIYGGQKKLTQLFTRKPGIVNTKADIPNSVFRCGDKITVNYEVTNDSNLSIQRVETKLVEINQFFLHQNSEVPITTEYDDVTETICRTGPIESGETQKFSLELRPPFDKESAEFSNMHTRDYAVFITAHLPNPHRKHVVQIPVQIGNIFDGNTVEAAGYPDEDPPSYWEAMNEYKTDKIED